MQYINLTNIIEPPFPQRERERESLPRGICEAIIPLWRER